MVSQKLTDHKRNCKTHFSILPKYVLIGLQAVLFIEQLDWCMVLLSVVIDYHHTSRVLCFIGHTRACEIKRRRAAAGGLWFWFVWFFVRVVFGLCGFRFVWLSICLLSPFCGIQRGI